MMNVGIDAISKMLEMAQGVAKLGQGGEQGAQGGEGAQGQEKQDPMKMLMDKLSKAAGGAQGGAQGGGSGGSEGQMDAEQLEKMMAGRQGMDVMMPADDSNRKIEV